MTMRLKGVDISAYQSGPPAGLDFYWIKATEGTGYFDSEMPGWLATVLGWGKLAGLYHFSDLGDPVAEADFFVSSIRPHLKPGVAVCIDHETASGSPSADAAFARTWCSRVTSLLGFKPVVYCNQAFANEGRCAGLGSNPLWLARYSAITSAGIGPWATSTFQQYTSSPEDEDVFFGTRDQFLALSGQGPAPTPSQEDDVLSGWLKDAPAKVTPMSWEAGKATAIGFGCDNGLQGLPPAEIRVAAHSKAGGWDQIVNPVVVDSSKGKTVIKFKAKDVDMLSVERLDDGAVAVCWDAS